MDDERRSPRRGPTHRPDNPTKKPPCHGSRRGRSRQTRRCARHCRSGRPALSSRERGEGGRLHSRPGRSLDRLLRRVRGRRTGACSSKSATPIRNSPSRASPSCSSSPPVCDLLGPGRGPSPARGQQHRDAVRLGHGRRTQRGPHHEPDGERRRGRPRRAWCQDATADEKFARIVDALSVFAGRPLVLDEAVFESEAANNDRNRGIAHLLNGYGRMYSDPDVTTEAYAAMLRTRVARDLGSWRRRWPTAG